MRDDERRKESRIRSRGQLHLMAGGGRIPGTIFDVSVWGISVEAPTEIGVGTPVHIDGEGFAAQGVVRYCGAHGAVFRIGIALDPAAPT